MTETAIATELQALRDAVLLMARVQGTRLTLQQLAERLGVSTATIARRLKSDRHFPRPDVLGTWLLSDVIEWNLKQNMDTSN